MRHAKARFADPGMRDFDRPLEPIGMDNASSVGRDMAERDWIPDLVLCSTAIRAKQTWDASSAAFPAVPQTRFREDLYNADATGYVRIIQSSGAESALMLVGHNPMIEDVTLALASPDDEIAEQLRRSGFPTAGLAVIDFEQDFDQIQPGCGRIVEILKPGGR